MIEISFLKDAPEHVPLLAHWFFHEWAYLYPQRALVDVEKKLEAYLNDEKIPLSIILREKGEVVATASLCAHDMETRLELSPWIESVYVPKEKRHKGFGEKAVRALMAKAREMGIGRLYLYTPDQEKWYAKMGWQLLERTPYRGTTVTIMTHDLVCI